MSKALRLIGFFFIFKYQIKYILHTIDGNRTISFITARNKVIKRNAKILSYIFIIGEL